MEKERIEGRVLPHSEEAERAVLGALLVASDRIAEVSEIIAAEDFHRPRHQLLFAALVDLANRNAPVDFLTVGEALKASGHFQAVGGHEFLIELAQGVTSAARAAHHARMIAETALLRRLIEQSSQIVEDAYLTRPDGDSVRKLLDQSEQKIFDLSRHTVRESTDHVRSLLHDVFTQIEARSNRDLVGLSTGFYDLDAKLCGLNKGDLVIIAARPSMGKTAFALNLAVSAALSRPSSLEGRAPTVLFFSLEMGKQQIVQRMLCAQAGVEGFRLRTGRLPDEDWSALNDAAGVLNQTSVFIDDSPSLSVMSLRARARRLKAKQGLDLVVVDYLQLMSHPKSESRQIEISEISRSLKALARELQVPVVALAQLSRAVEGKDREPRGWPMLSDLRESGSIEQDADVVMMLYRPWYYVADKQKQEEERSADEIEREKIAATIIISKHRNGPTGEVQLNFRERFMRFENPALSTAEPIFA